MANEKYFGSYFPRNYQVKIIMGFTQFKERIKEVSNFYHTSCGLALGTEKSMQLIHIIIIQYLFGVCRGKCLSIFEENKAILLNDYISDLFRSYTHFIAKGFDTPDRLIVFNTCNC